MEQVTLNLTILMLLATQANKKSHQETTFVNYIMFLFTLLPTPTGNIKIAEN